VGGRRHNKRMTLTKAEHIGALRLIPVVRPTWGECDEGAERVPKGIRAQLNPAES
jgi:hypothetical protein